MTSASGNFHPHVNPAAAPVIGICGGIGSGKSIVSRILRLEGESVYDCDFEAKRLMDGSEEIKHRIAAEISPQAISADGTIDRTLLAATVFSDPSARAALNAIVHKAVRDDITSLSLALGPDHRLFVESAILAQSGLAAMCSRIWLVDAGCDSVRIKRVMDRNNCDAETVKARIEAQKEEYLMLRNWSEITDIIDNSGDKALLPQIQKMIKSASIAI